MSRNKQYDGYLEMPRDELLAKIAKQQAYADGVCGDLHMMKEALKQRDSTPPPRYCYRCGEPAETTTIRALSASMCTAHWEEFEARDGETA